MVGLYEPQQPAAHWRKNLAVVYFSSAASRRFCGATWSIFHPALNIKDQARM
jgi:hypothetical protein